MPGCRWHDWRAHSRAGRANRNSHRRLRPLRIHQVPKPLLLISTAPGRNPGEGTARIGTEPRNPQTYSGGAILANGARLAEIHSDHVVIERSGQRISLYVGKSATPSELSMVGGAASLPAATRFAGIGWSTSFVTCRTTGTRLSPACRFPGRPAGVFAQLGLKAGDVIAAQRVAMSSSVFNDAAVLMPTAAAPFQTST